MSIWVWVLIPNFLGFWVLGMGIDTQFLGYWVLGMGIDTQFLGYWVLGMGWVSGLFGFWVLGMGWVDISISIPNPYPIPNTQEIWYQTLFFSKLN